MIQPVVAPFFHFLTIISSSIPVLRAWERSPSKYSPEKHMLTMKTVFLMMFLLLLS